MIKLNNVSKSFNDVAIFENFSIEFELNKITSILGPSGIGKTTLINLLCEIITPDKGDVLLPENTKFSYVFQEHRLLEWYDVYNNVDLVIKNLYDKNKRKEIVENVLEVVGLSEFSKYIPSELSGGMAQRVSIARALAYPSNILILDEPFKGLDLKLEDEIISSLKEILANVNRTVVFITHSIEQALTLSDDIYVINNKPAQVVLKKSSTNFSREIIQNRFELIKEIKNSYR